MSCIRTQVYLTRDQRRKLDARADREGTTLAGQIREALDRYLEEEPLDAREALKATFGRLPDIKIPPRSEWDRGRG